MPIENKWEAYKIAVGQSMEDNFKDRVLNNIIDYKDKNTKPQRIISRAIWRAKRDKDRRVSLLEQFVPNYTIGIL